MVLGQVLANVEQAEQRPALAATPAVPVGPAGPFEEEVREEPVRTLEELDQRKRLTDARIDQGRVARDAAEVDEERRVEVEAVDEDAGARIVEERLLVRRQRGVTVRRTQRRPLECDVDAPERAPPGEKARELEARSE